MSAFINTRIYWQWVTVFRVDIVYVNLCIWVVILQTAVICVNRLVLNVTFLVYQGYVRVTRYKIFIDFVEFAISFVIYLW